MSAPAETPTSVPAELPAPVLPYAPERRTEIERLEWGAAVAATACCDVWDEVVADLIGGAR